VNSVAPSSRGSVPSADGSAIAYCTLGSGEGIVVVGGALSSGEDYLPFAHALSESFAVHVVDRRGRGASGPQGTGYSIETECEDLIAVQMATGATSVFGHSYGGLVALETARRTDTFLRVAVYEPAVSINGSIPVGWMPCYRKRLVAGDSRGAFACFVRQAGFAPSALARMPLWYARAVLRVVIRQPQWRHMEPLLAQNLAEHEVVADLDEGSVDRFRAVSAPVLLLGGGKSPAFINTKPFEAMQSVIPNATVEILDGLDHLAPSETAPEQVAARVREFLDAVPTPPLRSNDHECSTRPSIARGE
jgi:pimeloyl-ACP methyl ester carboxylesterase